MADSGSYRLCATDPARFQRAGAGWHARFVLEAGCMGLLESQLALAAVARLANRDAKAAKVISDLASRYRIPNVEAALHKRG